MMKSASQRKANSIEVLKSEGIPYIDHLPELETVSETIRRSEREVAQRAIAVAITAVKVGIGDQGLVLGLIDEFGALGFFSHDERSFIHTKNSTYEDAVRFSWRYECVNVLLWALQIFDQLPPPYEVADVDRIAEVMKSLGTRELITQSRLRDQEELLDQTDLAFRYHWAVVEARLSGMALRADLIPSVVVERHYALNWLTPIEETSWDDVDTST